MNSIPKTIYYCWFGGNKPQSVLACINNWKEKLPNYEVIEINEYNKDLFDIEKECKNNLWFKTVWENKMWAYVADYARLKVLYEKGGVYFDTDITVEKDITELLEKNKLILGCESNNSINGSVIITPTKNKNILNMLQFYKEKIWILKVWAIPSIITYTIKNNSNWENGKYKYEDDNIVIYPVDYFYPMPNGASIAEEYITSNSYTIHWWNASWDKTNIDYFLRNKHKFNSENINKLIEYCFSSQTIINNPFMSIEKLCQQYTIKLDLSYILKFKHKYYGKDKYLTVFILGLQIRLFKRKVK